MQQASFDVNYKVSHMEKYICNIYVKIYEMYFRKKLYN